MEVLHPVCCGADVHQKSLTACLRRALPGGEAEKTVREFSTDFEALGKFVDWLVENECSLVAVESTGVYWRPVYNVLRRSGVQMLLANPQSTRPAPGKKTDKRDARLIADYLAHGLITPSFIPPPELTAVRDLTRLRTSLVNDRTAHKNRVAKVLEDSNVKLASVVSDLFSKSGREMLNHLLGGERDPEVLADLAKGVLRRKIPELQRSLTGLFTEHHALMIAMALQNIDLLEAQIAFLDQRIAEASQPFAEAMARLDTIPGVDQTAARIILSEIGPDMAQFGSAERLASWAGMCPGNNISAGKRHSGRTRKANKHLRRVLVQCAWSARQTPTAIGHKFTKLRDRIGGKKAAVAIGHTILVIAYHLLSEAMNYDEGRYGDLSQRQGERLLKRAVRTLESLGFSVELKQQAA